MNVPRDLLQQEKLLRLQQFFLEETDEDHGVTVADIQEYLQSFGISAERKSIYENIETLTHCGLDIDCEKIGNRNYYRLVSRDFETAELRLLADAVASSRFITAKKSAELLTKRAGLASRHQGSGLQRQVFVTSRIKNMNETIFYLIDDLNRAFSENVAVEFFYTEWVLKGGVPSKKPRHGGKRYLVSPWQLLWEDEFYYLIAFDHEKQAIRHYRVDRLEKLTLTDQPRQGIEEFRALRTEEYAARVFGMFAGQTEQATIAFPDHFLAAMIDRFGKGLRLIRREDGRLQITVEVVPSPHFFGWLFSLGEEVSLIAPQELKEKYIAALRLELEKEQHHG